MSLILQAPSARKAQPSVRKHRGTLLILTILACAAALLLVADDYGGAARGGEARVLRVSALNEYASNATSTAATVTVHIADRSHGDGNDMSIFYTDILRRWGSGRVGYHVVENRGADLGCRAEPFAMSGPCLAVTRRRRRTHHEFLGCNYPQCKTMLTNDELCQADNAGFDVRSYYSATRPHAGGYLPLGPREDAWESLRQMRGAPGFAPKAASERGYAFNAIFSQSTNAGRGTLAKIIASQGPVDPLSTFTTMAKEWTAHVDDPRSTQLDTGRYMAVMLDSAFTLAPAGHNPECYRLYEAAEAGSIPVLLRADLHGGPPQCGRSLARWDDAPVLVLDEWADLYPTIAALVADPMALNTRQERLRVWYAGYMRSIVAEFEEFMVGTGDGGERGASAEAVVDHAPEADANKKKKRKAPSQSVETEESALLLDLLEH